jgi:hypothetical protein
MKFHRKALFIIFTLLFIFTLGWDLWLYTLSDNATTWNFLYNVVYGGIFFVGGGVSVQYAIRYGLRTNLGKMLFYLGLGLLSFWAGNIIWVYYTFILKVPVPFPSLADAAYTLLYPLMAIGTFYLLKIYQTLITRRVIRDAVIILILSFAVIFGFFARPDVSEGLPLIQKIINVYYPFGDVIITSMALIALRIGGGKIHFSLYIFALGMVLQTAADLFFTYRNAVGTYWNGDISDLLYTLSAYFISVGIFEIINSLNQAKPVVAPLAAVPAPTTVPAVAPIPETPTPVPAATSTEGKPEDHTADKV